MPAWRPKQRTANIDSGDETAELARAVQNLSSSPIITVNWEASSDEWTIPLGGGVGRVFKVGSQPMNSSAQAF